MVMAVNCEIVYHDDESIVNVTLMVAPRAEETISLRVMENGKAVEKLFVVEDIVHVVVAYPIVPNTVHYLKVYVEDVD